MKKGAGGSVLLIKLDFKKRSVVPVYLVSFNQSVELAAGISIYLPGTYYGMSTTVNTAILPGEGITY